MGKKIFVSYKYSDSNVLNLPNNYWTTVRHYVDEFQLKLKYGDHISKGENDGESLATLSDASIASKLGDKIYDSSITVVFISPGMKDATPQREQWIPWEISYSLREQSRAGRVSKTNAVLAVILPDAYGSYDYFSTHDSVCNCNNFNTTRLFDIIRLNMFNKKENMTRVCNGQTIYEGYFSFIDAVRWNVFIGDIDKYLDIALHICSNKDQYNLKKNVD
jgi:hypothetical protein